MICLRVLMFGALIAGTIAPPVSSTTLPEEIWLLFEESRSTTYQPSNPSDLQLFEDLFAEILSPKPDLGPLTTRFSEIGFQLLLIDDSWLIITELQDLRHGRGFFVVNLRPEIELFVQAPHRIDDRSSGQMTLDLLAAGASAVGISTVSRNLVDIAHSESSEMSAATSAFAVRHPNGSILQLHGYASEAHPDLDAYDGILSNSTRKPSLGMNQIRTCIGKKLDLRIACFPQETSEFGGTTNSQACVARQHGLDFWHLELNLQARSNIRKNRALAGAMIDCFTEGSR